MSRRYIFICDGCDRSLTMGSPELPSAWADLEIAVLGYRNWIAGGSKEQKISRLLCGECQIMMRAVADPKQWERKNG